MSRFTISLAQENIINFMRKCGYAPMGRDEKTGELCFAKPARGYPRFHIYCSISEGETKAVLNLHLDQKKPSYQGTSAHSGEYEGALVEKEAERIQSQSIISR